MIGVLCTARSGSSAFAKYLGKVVGAPINRVFIHRVPDEFKNMYEYFIDTYEKIYIIDRKDKHSQSESLAFRKTKYGDNFNRYFTKEVYDTIDYEYVEKCKKQFIKQSKVLEKLGRIYEIDLIYYEDLYRDKEKIKSLGLYNEKLYDLYLNPNDRHRKFENASTKLL